MACRARVFADLLQLKINANIMHKSECLSQHITYGVRSRGEGNCTRRRSWPSEIQRKRNIFGKVEGCERVLSGWWVLLANRGRLSRLLSLSLRISFCSGEQRRRLEFPLPGAPLREFPPLARLQKGNMRRGNRDFLGQSSGSSCCDG